tara:strand:+ start:2985 stop:3332 length:348 start_codon:yes stop_codon:yes gene_type:complete
MENTNTIIEQAIIREKYNSRGGGIEISLADWEYPNGKMTAYQNYLGGGMLGRVCSDCNIENWKEDKRLVSISEMLKKYFHQLTNHYYSDDKWAYVSYEENQKRLESAYSIRLNSI